LKPDEIIVIGISVVHERRRLFPKMTGNENLVLGTYSLKKKVEIEQRLIMD
jgi:ABC-type branched-subunit amino acid transport system ATPase component